MRQKMQFILTVLTLMNAEASIAMGNAKIYHVLEFGNGGRGDVSHVSIDYGDTVFPHGFGTGGALSAGARVSTSETTMMAVPQNVMVHWTADDGRSLVASVVLRDKVIHEDRFHGFRFVFMDDHVDVFELVRTKNWPKDLDVDEVKIFPDKP